MASKDDINKKLEEVLKQIEDPKAADAARKAAAHAEKTVRELTEARRDRIRERLKNATEKKAVDRHIIMDLPIEWGADCSGPDCTVGCGTGCIVGCLIGGGALIGFGAAGGSVGGAGTSIVINRDAW